MDENNVTPLRPNPAQLEKIELRKELALALAIEWAGASLIGDAGTVVDAARKFETFLKETN